MTPVAVLAAVGWLSAGLASAGPPKIDRSISKEPVYQSGAPKYGLLVFGPEGKDRVWLVLDGDTLYVDRNGNGNLTEPGEKVTAQKQPGRAPEEDGYTFEVGDVTVGGRTHKGLTVSFVPLKFYADEPLGKRPDVKTALAKNPNALAASLSLDVLVPGMRGGGLGNRVTFQAGLSDLDGALQFAATPADAPVVCLGGPLQITFYAQRPFLRVGRGKELVLVVGTPGIGPGTFAMLHYEGTIPEDVKPVAELFFPRAAAAATPLREKVAIQDRC
jgi:hypothetical protein